MVSAVEIMYMKTMLLKIKLKGKKKRKKKEGGT